MLLQVFCSQEKEGNVQFRDTCEIMYILLIDFHHFFLDHGLFSRIYWVVMQKNKILVVFIHKAPVHSKFDIDLCWEINKRWCCYSWKSPISTTQLYLIMSLLYNFQVAITQHSFTFTVTYYLTKFSAQNCIKMTEISPKDGQPALAPLGSATHIWVIFQSTHLPTGIGRRGYCKLVSPLVKIVNILSKIHLLQQNLQHVI